MNYLRLASLTLICVLWCAPGAFAKADPDEIERTAQAMCKAMVKADWTTYTTYVMPTIIKKLGGREQFMKTLIQTNNDLIHQGGHIDDCEILKPERILGTGTNLQAIVPMIITLRVPNKVTKRRGFLVANSDNSGETWTFCQGNAIDPINIDDLMPKASAEVKRQLIKETMSSVYKEISAVPLTNGTKSKTTTKTKAK